MTDHKKEALAWTDGVEGVLDRAGSTDATLVASSLIAQVHATLYLAEQQRIANLIAWQGRHNAVDLKGASQEVVVAHVEAELAIVRQIREGLGLA